ncbi:MAG TPA: hypothetical protein DCS93_05345 [Microscillaceae bacterium]|nr:hypothetical protein [Microscillaceae bacterium]
MFKHRPNRLLGCFIGGMIGDAVGAIFENNVPDNQGAIILTHPYWQTTDDTQLTLATLESIVEHQGVFPEKIAQRFLEWFQQKRLVGLGSATLQALQGLQVGGHWALVGRSGEFAAGNGAAMRIAPLAFVLDPIWDRVLIKDVCNITHKNDEAYVGALAVLLAIHFISADLWTDNDALWDYLIQELPDTKTRDALKLAKQFPAMSIELFAANFGNSGYVVETVLLALFAASKVKDLGFEAMLQAIIRAGGDTDTIASIAGQVAGTWLGLDGLPEKLLVKAKKMKEYGMFEKLLE